MKKFNFSIDGNKFEVSVTENENNMLDISVNGSNYSVEIDREANKVQASAPVAAPAKKTPGKVAPIATQSAAQAAAAATTVKSQLPGSIMKVLVSEGQSVKCGDVVLTIESMKMENSIKAEKDGTISKIYVEPGKSVMQGDKLFDMQCTASAQAAPAPVAAAPKATAAPKAAPAPAAPVAAGSGKPLKSPLPGSIIKILVSEGQAVKRGETLLTMESMKMENEIKAEKDCVVTTIKVTPGQNVMQDDVLLLLA